jgi:hypothetical protein
MTRTVLCTLAAIAVGCTNNPKDELLPGEQTTEIPASRFGITPCGADTDYEGDGTIDVHWEYQLDERGRDVHDVGHVLAGGPDMTMDSTYDNLDHLTLFVEHDTPDSTFTYEAIYDTLGNNTEVRYSDVYGTDPPYTDSTVYSDFDDFGHPAQSVSTSDDGLGGGSTSRTTYAYDDAGRLIQSRGDGGNDGSFESETTVVYDEAAHTVTSTTTNTSGSHSLKVKTYDSSNNLLTSHTDRFAADGTMHTTDLIITRDGERIRTFSIVFDGVVSSLDTYLYDCR